MSAGMAVYVEATGRSGAEMYSEPTSNVIIGKISRTGHEAIVQPTQINGRVFVNLAVGLSGWVNKRDIKFRKQATDE